jgi:hypothetical protein
MIHSTHLEVSITQEGVCIRYDPPWTMTLGSQARTKDLRTRLKLRFRHWDSSARFSDGRTYEANFGPTEFERAHIDRTLDAFAVQRLTPKMVEEALHITSVERIRWIKDGRLPCSGTGSFTKGRQVFQFYLHPVKEITNLARDHAMIKRWREEDRAAGFS